MWSVFFVFLSYLDRNFVKGDFLNLALDAEKESKDMFSMLNGTFCAKMSTVRENFLYQVSDGTEVVRSVVSPMGKLVSCSVIVNHMQVKSFMHECRLGLKQKDGRKVEARFARMKEAKLLCREFNERSERSDRVKRDDSDDAELQDKVFKRSKRGFTYPGTLWCGAGNMANQYGQLGEFAETDSCCRTHDHCPHVIHAFSSKYGHTNFKWHSICHCDCDNTLKDCLRSVNDTSSRVVGQAFFNVIRAPCFDFAYEEQCAERHWYGMCKRYEKFPIAVLQEAVPYDFGGIDVIDQLPLTPPKKTDFNKNEEEDMPKSTTQSAMSGPEEPSLRNVVTAAEDFIKVLATVSTSQSSTNDSDKAETQSSEKKKKRKNSGKKKKTSKKQKGKGKGRKRKQKVEAGVKIEDGTAVSTSVSKAEEVNVLSNFISESNKHVHSSRNRVSVNGYELGGKDEPSNEVMKDEPAMDRENVSTTSSVTVHEKAADEITLSTPPNAPQTPKPRKIRKGGRKKSKTVPPPSPEEHAVTAADIFVPTPATRPEQQSDTERTAGTPIVSLKVKRNRSKERAEREGSKKQRKDSSAPPIVAAPHENSSADNLKVIPLTRAPTVQSVPNTRRQISHRLEVHGGKTLNSSFSVLKRQKSNERRLGSSRRKTFFPVSSENQLLLNNSENLLPVLPTAETSDAPNNPAATSRPTEDTESHREWRLFNTVPTAPSLSTKRHRQTLRRQRRPRQKAVPAALGDGVSHLKQAEQTPMTFTTEPPNVSTSEELYLQGSEKTSATTLLTPAMSLIELSIERVKAQFSRKKRRKAALSMRQQ